MPRLTVASMIAWGTSCIALACWSWATMPETSVPVEVPMAWAIAARPWQMHSVTCWASGW